MRKIAVILVFSAILGTNLIAQERNDVIKVYNEGAKATQTDPRAAIEAFENVVKLSEQVGESTNDLKEKAMKVLPGLYFKVAYASLNEKKPAPEVIQDAKKAVAASEKYGSASNKENSGKVLLQAYNTMATDYFSQNDYVNALKTIDTLLAINPDYTTAIYNKALIYIRQDSADAFEETIDLFIEKLKSANDETRINQASAMALEYFRAAGSKANQADNLDEALTLLNKAAKYGDDKDLFYYFADVYNKKKNFDQGAEYARKGLDLEPGDAEAKAKFYFQLGLAQEGKGQTSDACVSFKNSLFGAFAEASKVQRANLKCE
jgi:tetratricopeptide (TPR) repeat protein